MVALFPSLYVVILDFIAHASLLFPCVVLKGLLKAIFKVGCLKMLGDAETLSPAPSQSSRPFRAVNSKPMMMLMEAQGPLPSVASLNWIVCVSAWSHKWSPATRTRNQALPNSDTYTCSHTQRRGPLVCVRHKPQVIHHGRPLLDWTTLWGHRLLLLAYHL